MVAKDADGVPLDYDMTDLEAHSPDKNSGTGTNAYNHNNAANTPLLPRLGGSGVSSSLDGERENVDDRGLFASTIDSTTDGDGDRATGLSSANSSRPGTEGGGDKKKKKSQKAVRLIDEDADAEEVRVKCARVVPLCVLLCIYLYLSVSFTNP